MRAPEQTAIELPELQLHGEFDCTAAPVQASGTIGQHRFYFRARHDGWRFAVAGDPVLVDSAEHGFIREGHWGSSGSDASYMPLHEARRIISESAAEFFRAHAP
jgi:hypothetical protein